MPTRPTPGKTGDAPPARPGGESPQRGSGEGSRTALARLIEQEKSRRSNCDVQDQAAAGPIPDPEEPSGSA